MILSEPENRKTIDVETGIFLTRTESRANEGIEVFSIFDGKKDIDLIVEEEIRDAGDGKVDIVRHAKTSFYFSQYPEEISKYSNIIKRLFAAFDYSYGKWPEEINSSEIYLEQLDKYLG
ncbi:hypothetical protein [Roseibium sp.]|uniref:hypothetical protein n=1 Tax=Roseibium sp. TaxID=1936156 RepID=UPI003BA95BAE